MINGSIKNYKRLVDTLNELIDKGELSGIRYGGYFRTHKKMDTEFFDEARKSGLVYMNIGVENGVAKTLGLMEKRQTPEIINLIILPYTRLTGIPIVLSTVTLWRCSVNQRAPPTFEMC